jgi:tetratricopeptide (TPR) repeat protein
MAINGILTKYIFDQNKAKHDFYIEESYVIPWMYPYLTPHGLIMKINDEPLATLPADLVQNDHEFWSWYTERLTSNPKFMRDVVARKTFSKLRSALGGLYVYRRNLAEAEHAFGQAIELYDLSPEANFRLADVYTQQAKYPEAIDLINRFLEKDEGNDKVRDYLGQIEKMQVLDQERRRLEPLLAQGVDLKTAMELVKVYRSLGRISQFEALATRLISDPKVPGDVYREVGQLSAESRRFGLALNAYTQWTQREPRNHEAWIELAATQLALRQHQEMFTSLTQAVNTGGESARSLLRGDTRFNAVRGAPYFQQLVPPATRPTGLNFGFGSR